MTKETFNECFTWLEKYHGSRQRPIVRDRYWQEFSGISDELFIEAINAVTRKRSAEERFPSIDDINKAIAEVREALWRKAKASEPKTPLTKPQLRTAYAADGFKAIWDVYSGKPYEQVAGPMEARWPGRGWKEPLNVSPPNSAPADKSKEGKWIH